MNESGQSVELYVEGLDCEHDAARLERALSHTPGVTAINVFASAGRVLLSFDAAAVSADQLARSLEQAGFPPRSFAAPRRPLALWRDPKVLTSGASGVLLLVGWLTGSGGPVAAILYLAALVVGAYYFGREAAADLLFKRRVGIELLMLTAAIVAMLMGQAMEAAMLAFLYSISEAMEGYTEAKTRGAIDALLKLTPRTAVLRRGGRDVEVPVEQVVVGDVFLVRPGQSVATDGKVVTGSSAVNQAPVTGESVPVAKEPEDVVFAGSINGEGALEVRATAVASQNTIARIVRMVADAQERKGASQRFIEVFGNRYSPAVLVAGFLLAVVPPLFLGALWQTWIARATVFIVAAAPCALVLSIPVTMVATLGTAARKGVLIKGGTYVEALAGVRVVALDKTGTLTRGEPEVTDVQVAPAWATSGGSEARLLSLAAAIERLSQHPLAKAIVRYSEHRGVPTASVQGFRSLPAAGAVAEHEGAPIFVGSVEHFEQQLGLPLASLRQDIDLLRASGKTVVLVGNEAMVWGVLAIRDNLRPNARQSVESLRALGIRVVMLTGDSAVTATAIADEAGIQETYADLKPEEKAGKVRELAARYGSVAMVGDGVNDAPALAEAAVGIAMGAAGTDVAIETADVALMADNLDRVAYALGLARRNQTVIRQNLVLSTCVIAVFVVGALAGVLSLPVAVVAHEMSEFVVIGSGLRMLRA